MVLVTANMPQQLLALSYAGRVTPAELANARSEIALMLADLSPDFRLLADLSHLEAMEPDCALELGRAMELIDQHGVKLIARVIPDASKDIGLNILSIFHYARLPRIITSPTLADALQRLAAAR